MARRFWWPERMADQVSLLNNFASKIRSYETTLGWTEAQSDLSVELCTYIIQAISYADSSKATMQSVTQWRDLVLYGEPAGTSALPVPAFPLVPTGLFTRGCVVRFQKIRDQIVANDNYTPAIGEDLGLVGAEITVPSPESVSPNLKVTVTDGESVVVSGSMRGTDAMRMIYTPKGGVAREVAFVTSTPAGFQITKSDPEKPENGELRAVFFKKNLPYGNPSPIYPITLA